MSRVCIYINTFGDGGVERMLVNLARGLNHHGVEVDFIINHSQAPYLDQLPKAVRLIEFQTRKPKLRLQKLLAYLDEYQPDAMISAKTKDDRVALAAKQQTQAKTRFFLRPGTALSERLRARRTNPLKRWLTYRRFKQLFNQADGIIAVSQGVADDVVRITGVDPSRISVVRNPNITPEFYQLAAQALDHPWLEPGQPPVLIGMGGLRRQKDFPSLLRAFAQVAQERPCRLMILGSGHKQEELLKLADSLGVADRVQLPGFIDNPYAYLSRAALFVLSSLWEGSPNVLTESLALGIPVVATDCPSGPYEITQGGKYGQLVPVGDVAAMSRAIRETLDNPPDPTWLKTAVEEYTMERSAQSYLAVMGLELPDTAADGAGTSATQDSNTSSS
jgi:glycosyltransferase involved in cell wall biosynthesis